MVNLLPHEVRERAAMEYRLRLGAVVCAGTAILILLATALLLPAYFFAWVARNNAQIEQALVEQSLSHEDLTAAADSGRAAAQLYSSVQGVRAFGRPSSIIEALSQSRTQDVSITHIDYQNNGNTSVNVSGVAETRDALLAFKQALSEVPGIVSADFPISNLTKPTDIPFRFSVVYVKPRN